MKNKFPLIIAIIIGVAALLAIRSYVKKEEQRIKAQLKGERVVAAEVDIAAGAELTMQMLSPKEVPVRFISPQDILISPDKKEIKQLLGRKTRVAIGKGENIQWTALVSEVRGGLSTIIPPGEGAYSVSIGKGIKPGLIQPSDHIDVIGSFALPKPNQPLPVSATASNWRQGSDMVNVVLLQNVTVLAVGDVFGGASRAEGASGAELTLSLTLPEAQLLMFAAEHGELGAILRREGVTDIKPRAELPRITFQAIEQIIGDLDNKRNTRVVEVQKGPKTVTVPVINSP
jgi:Flp pilus assembly protein CpaB